MIPGGSFTDEAVVDDDDVTAAEVASIEVVYCFGSRMALLFDANEMRCLYTITEQYASLAASIRMPSAHIVITEE